VGAAVTQRVSAPLGRVDEHETVLRVLDELAHEPRALLLTGDAGIGKTTVLDAGLSEARRRGYRVVSCRPGAAEVQLSFVGLGDLLEGVVTDVLPGLPPRQERALTTALGLGEEIAPEPRLLRLAVLNVLRSLAAERPLVVGVDDLQWLDAPSAELLVFALRRLTDQSVGLLATAREETVAAAPLELDRGLAGRLMRLEIGPLSLGAIQRLLRDELEVPLSRLLLRRIYERSGGNPFYALELARALADGGDERLPESLRRLVADRVERLPKETRALLATLATAAQPTLMLVGALDGEAALEPAEKEGVVVVEGTRIRFRHPLLAAAAHDGATSRERRAAHRRLAQLVDDPEEHARHLALAAEGPDEEIAAALDAAAASSLARGAPGAAAELAEQALALTPPKARATIHRRRLEAARRCRTLGNSDRQRVLLEQALADAASDREKAEPLWQLAGLAADEGDGATARALNREALDRAAGDDNLCAAIYLDAVWLEGGFGGAVEPARAALRHAERSGDRALEAEALSAVAHASFSHGLGFRRELFERALELERTAGFIDAERRPTTSYGLTAKWAGDIPRSRELLEEAAARAREDEDASGTVVLYYLTWLHLIAGEWERALERADESQQLAIDAARDGDAAAAVVTRAIVEAHLGRIGEAQAHLDETSRLAQDAERGLADDAVLWAWGAGLVASSSGRPEIAVEQLEPLVAGLLERGLEEPAYHPWFPTYADALIQVGRLDDAEELTDWFEERAVRLERRWALAMCAHLRGAIQAARGNLDDALQSLERAVQLHEDVGRPFDRAWTLLVYGQTLRRAKRRRLARETLEEALLELERLGAALWAEKARGELGRIGGRAPSGGLTPTEERLAGLVAEGKSNKEVATELFVTVRTVETNLSRIYSKLGLHSRGELAAWVVRS
jgi:DNA-binding CsgD family transcriptional regulator